MNVIPSIEIHKENVTDFETLNFELYTEILDIKLGELKINLKMSEDIMEQNRRLYEAELKELIRKNNAEHAEEMKSFKNDLVRKSAQDREEIERNFDKRIEDLEEALQALEMKQNQTKSESKEEVPSENRKRCQIL